MNNHNNQKHGVSMMWIMLGCAVLLAVLFFAAVHYPLAEFFGQSFFGVLALGHIWMMFQGR